MNGLKMLEYLEDINAISPISDDSSITNGHQTKQSVRRWALIIVDVQNDFVTGTMSLKNVFNGENASEVIPIINSLLQQVQFDVIAYSRDFHPPNHCSFKSSSVKPKVELLHKWPDHCVEFTWGSEFADGLITDPSLYNSTVKKIYIKKGTKRDEECFSAFRGEIEQSQSMSLQEIIKNEKIDQIFICGLATDFCVLETCRDAINFCNQQEIFLLVDASRGVKSFQPKWFQDINVKMITTKQLIQSVLINKEKSCK